MLSHLRSCAANTCLPMRMVESLFCKMTRYLWKSRGWQSRTQSLRCAKWFARNGRDYREVLEDAEDAKVGVRTGESDLLEILRKDPDPFIRACVYANPAFAPLLSIVTAGQGEALGALLGIGILIKTWWSEATDLERLGMARNRHFGSCLLDEMRSNELDLTLEQRRELILAFLAARDEVRDRDNGELWEVISEWPRESDVPPFVYRWLPVNDETASKVYKRTLSPEWRCAILEMIWDVGQHGPRELRNHYRFHNETLRLAMSDSSGTCRLFGYAASRLGGPFDDRRNRSKRWRDLRRAASKDTYALSGLAKNASLSLRELRWVERRAQTWAGPLNSKQNLWVNLGEGKGYPHSEVDLPVEIHRDIERRIPELRFKKRLSRLRRSGDGSLEGVVKFEQPREKLDYLTLVSLSASLGLRDVFSVTGLGLIAFSVTYLISHNLALSLFAFFLWSWLRRLVWPPINPVAPWLHPDEYVKLLSQYWSERSVPKKPPLIEDRPVAEVERETARLKWREKFETEIEKDRERLKVHQRERNGLVRKTRRNWYLLKRKARLLTCK
jgi:hypothetical protein